LYIYTIFTPRWKTTQMRGKRTVNDLNTLQAAPDSLEWQGKSVDGKLVDD